MNEKFKGCMVGGLVGDCLGGPFEDDTNVKTEKVRNFFSQLVGSSRTGQYSYTDDTAMAWNTLDSLFEKQTYDPKDMSQRYADTYFKESFRYYGGHIITIFAAWKRHGLVDVYQPAQLQFNGSGSYGNGGAMRVAPIALYHCNSHKDMIKLATLTTCLTHTHPLGIVGSLLQCWAVRLALDENSDLPFDVENFITRLQEKVYSMHVDCGSEAVYEFNSQLTRLKHFVRKDEVNVGEVVESFGHIEVAHKSIVTALYCFLRATREVDFISADNPFERTIQLAVSMGGDTDTIACMAGSIAGSFYGFNKIPQYLLICCEKLEEAYNIGVSLRRIFLTRSLFVRRVSLFGSRIKFTFISADDEEHAMIGQEGQSIYEAVLEYGLNEELKFGECDGKLCCGTCCVILNEATYEKNPIPNSGEEWIMDERDRQIPFTRLGCQVLLNKEMDGMTIRQSKIIKHYIVDP
ncbi:hypothetical protein CHUAL_009739 [Chamberlinius hualienensis]